MRGDRIIETTGEFFIYVGAELTAEEREFMKAGCADYKPLEVSPDFYSTFRGLRGLDEYVAERDAAGMLRERDLKTGEIREGLGRW